MRTRLFYGWVIVAITFVTMGIGVNARTAFSLFFPSIIDEFQWERGLTAGAFSFGFVVSAGFSPLIGRMMDRFGPRVVMETGVLLMAAGLLLAPLTTEVWHLYLTMGLLVGGGSVCLSYTGQSLYLPNWFVRQRGLAMGIAFAGVGIGSIILFPVVGYIIAQSGWRTASIALGILMLVVLVPINLMVRQRPQDMGLLPDGDHDGSGEGGAAKPQKPTVEIVDPAWAATDWTLTRAMRTARFWWLSLGFFCGLYSWYAVQVHQTKYLMEVGFSSTLAVWALGAVSLLGIPGQILMGHLSDRIGREWIWTISGFGFIVCFGALIGLAYVPSIWLVYLMIVTQGFIGYGTTAVMAAVVVEIFEGRHYGSIFGTIMLAGLAGGAAGPWLTGLLHDWYGDYIGAFSLAIAFSLLGCATVWLAAPGKV
ncbi:MAG: MFS transporter, partial [Xanthobacteraceae bacterium]